MDSHTEHKNVCGPVVARLRNELGMSQAELAAQCQRMGWDVSRDIIARIEGQVRWVGDFELIHLSKALGKKITDLLP